MNITIKIAHSNGTVMDISIPVLTPDATLSAVTTPPEPQAASEPAIPAVNAASEDLDLEVTKEDLRPTGKRYSSVEAMVADTLGSEFVSRLLACDTTGEKRVGEDEVGAGRIGGMGERKDRGEEAGREKGNPCIYKMLFRCSDGETFAPVAVLDLAVEKYGVQTTHEEMVKAAQWLIANPGKKRKKKGLGTFLVKWFERSAEFRAQRRKINSGNLLNEETTDQAW